MLEQAGRNREYQIAVALPMAARDVAPEKARTVALGELALADYRFDRFRSRPDEATKVDAVHVVPLAGEDEKGLGALVEHGPGGWTRWSGSRATSATGRGTTSRRRRSRPR